MTSSDYATVGGSSFSPAGGSRGVVPPHIIMEAQ